MGMVLVVAAFAMAFAALRSGSDLWFGAFYTFTVVLLLLAVIVARFRHGDEKAFWFGFAVFGWGFFLVGFGPWMNPVADSDEGLVGRLNPSLLTSRFIFFLVALLRKGANDIEDIDKITANTIGIAHLLIALSLALCGGMIAALVRRRRGKQTSVKSWSIVAGLAVSTACVSCGFSPAPPTRFFPAMAFDEREDLSDFTERWYSKHLQAMAEPSLWALSRKDRVPSVYRLLWLPSFHHTVCVRMERSPEGAKLHAKVLDGMGGYEPGLVAIDRNLELTDEEWNGLEQGMEQAQFWAMPTRYPDDGGCDGDELIVEGIRGGTYHVVDRWMPEAAYKELCRHMLDLADLDVQKTWSHYH
jgi:hypothetical protein